VDPKHPAGTKVEQILALIGKFTLHSDLMEFSTIIPSRKITSHQLNTNALHVIKFQQRREGIYRIFSP
jgi:hypothetical protein